MKCFGKVTMGVIALWWTYSCSSESVSPVKEPRVRVSNLTERTLLEVQLRLPGEEVEFGSIPIGATTGYVPVRKVYADACVIAMITTETALLFHCWADGGTPPALANGDYTIELSGGAPELRVVRDDG